MDVKVVWKDGLSFSGLPGSGFAVPLGTSVEVGGDDDGPRPMELIVIGLGGCTSMDVVSILQKKGQHLSAFEVQVHADRAGEHPKVITRATIEYQVTGQGVQEEALLRAIELSATKYCPGIAMLGQVFPIEFKYQIFEGTKENERVLVKSGEYQISHQSIEP